MNASLFFTDATHKYKEAPLFPSDEPIPYAFTVSFCEEPTVESPEAPVTIFRFWKTKKEKPFCRTFTVRTGFVFRSADFRSVQATIRRMCIPTVMSRKIGR